MAYDLYTRPEELGLAEENPFLRRPAFSPYGPLVQPPVVQLPPTTPIEQGLDVLPWDVQPPAPPEPEAPQVAGLEPPIGLDELPEDVEPPVGLDELPEDVEPPKEPGFLSKLDTAYKEGAVSAYHTADDIVRALKRGWIQGDVSMEMQNATPDFDAISKKQKQVEEMPASKDYLDTWDDKKSWRESWDAFSKNPVGNIGQLLAESMGAMARTQLGYIGKIPERTWQGMVGGAAIGTPVAGVGAVPGMGIGAGIGAATGFAESAMLASKASEYSGSILDSLRESGVDLKDPEQLRKAFTDPEKMAAIRAKAERKSVPIAIFDGLSAAIGGRLFSAPAKTVGKKLGQWAIEMGVQMAAGGGGEAVSQLASEGKITSAKSILGEIIAEPAAGVGEVAAGRLHAAVTGPEAPVIAPAGTPPAVAPAGTAAPPVVPPPPPGPTPPEAFAPPAAPGVTIEPAPSMEVPITPEVRQGLLAQAPPPVPTIAPEIQEGLLRRQLVEIDQTLDQTVDQDQRAPLVLQRAEIETKLLAKQAVDITKQQVQNLQASNAPKTAEALAATTKETVDQASVRLDQMITEMTPAGTFAEEEAAPTGEERFAPPPPTPAAVPQPAPGLRPLPPETPPIAPTERTITPETRQIATRPGQIPLEPRPIIPETRQIAPEPRLVTPAGRPITPTIQQVVPERVIGQRPQAPGVTAQLPVQAPVPPATIVPTQPGEEVVTRPGIKGQEAVVARPSEMIAGPLKGVTVNVEGIAPNGDRMTTQQDATDALMEAKKDRTAFQLLLDCLT